MWHSKYESMIDYCLEYYWFSDSSNENDSSREVIPDEIDKSSVNFKIFLFENPNSSFLFSCTKSMLAPFFCFNFYPEIRNIEKKQFIRILPILCRCKFQLWFIFVKIWFTGYQAPNNSANCDSLKSNCDSVFFPPK